METFVISQNFWQFPVLAIVCYLIGSFNAALLIARIKKRDIRKLGSGNPGTMNVSRELGWRAGILTFLLDALKGVVPVVIAYFLYRNFVFENSRIIVADFMRYYCGLFVVIGHIFPVTMKFKGGKGIASTFGVFWGGLACENAWWTLGMLGACLLILLFIYFTQWGGLGSLLGVSSFSIIQLVYFYFRYARMMLNAYLVWLFLWILLLNVFTWLAHYKNLRRLFSGEEHRTSLQKIVKKK